MLAEAAGVSTDTLRHYERKGVLLPPPRSANGYRRYPVSALERVRLIRSSLAIGFTLDELARILSERDKGGSPCREVHGLAVKKLAELEEQIRSLTDFRKRLRLVVEDWNDRVSRTRSGAQARLLDSLSLNGRADLTNGRQNLSLTRKKKSGDR